MEVHTIYLIGAITLNYVLAFSTSEYLFSSSPHCMTTQPFLFPLRRF